MRTWSTRLTTTGYGWARYLRRQGRDCDVIEPTHLIGSAAKKRIKTDRRDALLQAKESRAGNLVSNLVPDPREEAIRDLSRSREDALATRLRARQHLKSILLRYGRNYNGKCAWNLAHEHHLATARFDHPAQGIAFNEYRQAIRHADQRLTEALRHQSAGWRMNPLVRALMCLRGLDFISAITFAAEIGDLSRFSKPPALVAYLGPVPSIPVAMLSPWVLPPKPVTSMPCHTPGRSRLELSPQGACGTEHPETAA